MSRIIEEDPKSISLKKRWLAHHHDDEQHEEGVDVGNGHPTNLTQLNQYMREHDFQDWQTITVLVQIQSNEYLSGKITDIGLNGCLTVQTKDSKTHQINVWQNLFGILSDNAPSIQDLVKGKFILCKKEDLYQTAVIIDKTKDGKFQVLFKDQKEIFCVPRQAIRLFLPPWHDGGLCFFFSFKIFSSVFV